jgi:hypothetical protein
MNFSDFEPARSPLAIGPLVAISHRGIRDSRQWNQVSSHQTTACTLIPPATQAGLTPRAAWVAAHGPTGALRFYEQGELQVDVTPDAIMRFVPLQALLEETIDEA